MTFEDRLLASAEAENPDWQIGAWCITYEDGFFRVTVVDPFFPGKKYTYVVQGDQLVLESEQEAE
jgi:hypothetical protein